MQIHTDVCCLLLRVTLFHVDRYDRITDCSRFSYGLVFLCLHSRPLRQSIENQNDKSDVLLISTSFNHKNKSPLFPKAVPAPAVSAAYRPHWRAPAYGIRGAHPRWAYHIRTVMQFSMYNVFCMTIIAKQTGLCRISKRLEFAQKNGDFHALGFLVILGSASKRQDFQDVYTDKRKNDRANKYPAIVKHQI